MEKLNKRPWRKLVKKLQRKRRRQKMAQEKEKQLEEDELKKLQDPLYKSWVTNQQEVERLKLLEEEKDRQEQEEQWLRRELIAQTQFQRDEQKRKALEAEKEAVRLQQELELKQQEEALNKKREELKKQALKAAQEFEDTMDCMQKYLDDSNMKTPRNLEKHVESRPGEKLCDFYEKTNCCRFGPGCSYNHKRPLLAKIIVIRHFFHHPLLEEQQHEEYARGDGNLELNERDLRDSYDEFCADVWPELEEFGDIVNFRAVRNIQAHLRGHVFVEFSEKRSALKAFIKLQNRYYASKRLNVEFSNLRHWRTGVCGMLSFLKGLSLGRRCPKGFKCNFLHLMQNPNNKYNTPMESPGRTPQTINYGAKIRLQTPLLSWNNLDPAEAKVDRSRNWRWSESPEVELKSSSASENIKSPPQNVLTLEMPKMKEKNHKSKHHKRTGSKSPSKRKNSKPKHKSRRRESSSSERSNSPSQRQHSKSNSTSDEIKDLYSPRETKTKNSKHRKNRSKSPTSLEKKSKHKKSKRQNSPEAANTGKNSFSGKSDSTRCKSKKRSKSRSKSNDKNSY